MTSEVVLVGRVVERGGAGRMTERRVNWIGISLAGVVGVVLCVMSCVQSKVVSRRDRDRYERRGDGGSGCGCTVSNPNKSQM